MHTHFRSTLCCREFAHDEDGVIYYYSHALNISQYEHPATGKLEPEGEGETERE